MPGLHRFLLYDGFGLSTAAVFAPVAGAQRCRVFGSSRVYAMLFWQGISPSSRDSSMCLNLPFVFGWGWFQDFLFGIKRGKWLWTCVDQAKHWTQVLTTYDWQITQHHVAIVPCDVTRIVLVGWSGSPAVAGNLTPGLTPSPAAGVARWYGLCVWIVVAESGSIYVLNTQWSELSWCCFRDWM